MVIASHQRLRERPRQGARPHSSVTSALTILAALGALALASPVAASTRTVANVQPVAPGDSPYSGCTADQATAQEAQLGSGLWANSQVEPQVAVNPTNPQNIVGIHQQDRWNDGGSRGDVAEASLDGGATWRQVRIPGIAACDGGSWLRGTDPWLSFGPDGTLFELSESLSPPLGSGDVLLGLDVSTSADGGLHWSPPIDVSPLDSAAPRFPFDDKASITADPTQPGHAYVTWDRSFVPGWGWQYKGFPPENFRFNGVSQPLYFTRTSDGVHWDAPRAIYDPGANNGVTGAVIVVLPDGTLLDAFSELLTQKLNGGSKFNLFVGFVRSTDQGRTWSSPVLVPEFFTTPTDPETGGFIRDGGDVPTVAVDQVNGHVAVAWGDGRYHAGSGIAYSESSDGGRTWSAPVEVDRTPAGPSIEPAIAIAADGTIGVSYLDFRYDSAAPGLPTSAWLAHCRTSCTNAASWTETFMAGATATSGDSSFNIENAPATRGGGEFLGDYQGLAAAGSTFDAFFALPGSNQATDGSRIWFAAVGP